MASPAFFTALDAAAIEQTELHVDILASSTLASKSLRLLSIAARTAATVRDMDVFASAAASLASVSNLSSSCSCSSSRSYILSFTVSHRTSSP